MQPKSRAPVSAREPRSHFEALLPLGVGALAVGVIAATARQIEYVVEVGWFDSENLPHLAPLAARWVSVFLVSIGLYCLIVGAGAFAEKVRSHPGLEWARCFSAFMTLLSWIVALHFVVIMGALSGFQTTWPAMPYEVHLVFVASLAPLAWVTAFGLRADARTALPIFGAVLLTVALSLVLLDPYLLRMWAVDLGLRPPLPEAHLMITGRVVEYLPYLVTVGPVVWSSLLRWKQIPA